jgi:prepilin-type N-terminal cleavage/methylation domain-containing protein
VKGLSKNAGFSLVELMVVVGIIGILAAIAVPKLQMFSAKAKRAEAANMLRNVHLLQTAYFAENSVFGSGTDLGWSQGEGKYYFVTISPQPAASNSVYYANADLKLVTGTALNIKLCPGQAVTAYARQDRWYVGECPETVSQCLNQLNNIRTVNPGYVFSEAPQAVVPNLLNSCR